MLTMTPVCDKHQPSLAANDGIVLDTNVVLDWLVFADPTVAQLGAQVAQGQLRWLGTTATLAELAVVLQRPAFDRWSAARDQAWGQALTWCIALDPGAFAPAPSPSTMRCTDRDDQKFIDLALHAGARWLLSRDKAVLRLARRARALGLVVQTPAQWLAQQTRPDPG